MNWLMRKMLKDKIGRQAKGVPACRQAGPLGNVPIIFSILAIFSYFAVANVSPQEDSSETVILASPLTWRMDGQGDYSLSQPGEGTHGLTGAVSTDGTIKSITASWEFKGEVSLKVSANNGKHYTDIVNGIPLATGFTAGNKLKWQATVGPDSELTNLKISYTDTSGVVDDFGQPLLSGFKYRKALAITNSSKEELFNYQIKIRVGESSSSYDYDVHCEKNIEADFKDIRFTAADGKTLLPYYIESITGSKPDRIAVCWVKLLQLPKQGMNIHLYYGNAQAEGLSDGEAVFDFFEDFSKGGLNLEAWQGYDFKQGRLEYKLRVEDEIKSLDMSPLTKEEIIVFFKTGKDFEWARVRKIGEPEPSISSADTEKAVSLAQFSNTTLAGNGNLVLSSGGAGKGKYISAGFSTDYNVTMITPSIEATGRGVSFDISADGGLTWKNSCVNGAAYSAPRDFKPGKSLKCRVQQGSLAAQIKKIKLVYSMGPVVSSHNIYVSGATGKAGVFQRPDTILVEWDNSLLGDNNPDILSVSCNFSAFGGSATAYMYDDGPQAGHGDKKALDKVYAAKYKLPDGIIRIGNIYVTVTNAFGMSTRDGHILSVDTRASSAGQTTETESEEQGIIEMSQVGAVSEIDLDKLIEAGERPGTEFYDAVIKLGDNTAANAEEDARACYKEGDVVIVQPAGHNWSENERASFLIVQAYLTPEEARQLTRPEKIYTGKVDEAGRPIQRTVRNRVKRIDLKKAGLLPGIANREAKIRQIRSQLGDRVLSAEAPKGRGPAAWQRFVDKLKEALR